MKTKNKTTVLVNPQTGVGVATGTEPLLQVLQVCGTCKFHDSDKQCRRYPPHVTVANYQALTRWPQVAENDWCGEWKEKQ